MHELGIVFYIIKDVKKVALENNVTSVKKVALDLGEVSTVIPLYLLDIWEWAKKKEEILQDCELKINTIKAITFCEDCKQEYETVKYGKTCPYCQSGNTFLKVGNEVEIREIEV